MQPINLISSKFLINVIFIILLPFNIDIDN